MTDDATLASSIDAAMAAVEAHIADLDELTRAAHALRRASDAARFKSTPQVRAIAAVGLAGLTVSESAARVGKTSLLLLQALNELRSGGTTLLPTSPNLH